MKALNMLKILLISTSIALLTACGGGGGGSQESSGDVKISFNGVAQLGYLSGSTVKLFNLNNELIGQTFTSLSENTGEAGAFTFDNISLDNDRFYRIEVSGGYDIDANDDGHIDEVKTSLKGIVNAINKGAELQQGSVRVNVLSDMLYQKIKSNIRDLSSDEIALFLDQNAKKLITDIDGDGEVTYQDINKFDPVIHKRKTLKPYQEILGVYTSKLHSNSSDEERIASLMVIDEPKVIVDKGLLQEVPFTLFADIQNLPSGVKVEWRVNNEILESIDFNIIEPGIYNIQARLYSKGGSKLLKSISTDVVATTMVDIASVEIDINTNNSIFVTDESNSSLAGTHVVIPKGALLQTETITIKRSLVNALPITEGVQLSDVLVMHPPGLVFEKPIQIRMPYNALEGMDINNIRIVRYSSDGTLDYLAPLFIDTEMQEIVFETDHFTAFMAETAWFSKTADELFIEKLNLLNIDGIDRSIEEWKSILNVLIDPSISFTVYDYLRNYMRNRKIYETIKSSKSNNVMYIKAFNEMYPDAIEASKSVAMWKEIRGSFVAIESLYTIQAVVANSTKELLNGLLTTLGFPSLNFSLYNPLTLADLILRINQNSGNEYYLSRYFDYAAWHKDTGKITVEEPAEVAIDFFKKNRILGKVEEFFRRYKSFEHSPETHLENAKNIINEAILGLKEFEKNQELFRNPRSYFSGSDIVKSLKNGLPVKFNIKVSTLGYQKIEDFDVEFSVYESLTKAQVLTSSDIVVIKKDFKKIDEINGYLTLDVTIDGLNRTGRYYLHYQHANGDVDDLEINITRLDKNIVRIKSIVEEGVLDNTGNYHGSVTAFFDYVVSVPYDVVLFFKGKEYNGKNFAIQSSDFSDSELESVRVLVTPSDRFKSSFDIDNFETNINLKSAITQSLEGQRAAILPQLRVVSVNGVFHKNSLVTIKQGDKVTFEYNIENVYRTFYSKFEEETDFNSLESSFDSYLKTYTYTYKNLGVFEPQIKLLLKSAVDITIRAPKITVNVLDDCIGTSSCTSPEPENSPPSIIFSTDTDIIVYDVAATINLKASVSDSDGSIVSTYWEPVYSTSPEVINPDSLDTAYITVAAIEKRHIYKLTVIDDQGARTVRFLTIRVKKEVLPEPIASNTETVLNNICKVPVNESGLAKVIFAQPLNATLNDPGLVTCGYGMQICDGTNYIDFGLGNEVHSGTDYRASLNTPVYSPVSGTITRTDATQGLLTIAFDSNGDGNRDSMFGFGHLNHFALGLGEVNKGDLIGYSGNRGNVTGPSLHVEYRPNYSGNSLVAGAYRSCGAGLLCTNEEVLSLTDNPADILNIVKQSCPMDVDLTNTKVTEVHYATLIAGEPTTFTIIGEFLPDSIAMSLHGAQCSIPYDIGATQVKMDCTVPLNATGELNLYIKAYSGGPVLLGAELLTVIIGQVVVEPSVPTTTGKLNDTGITRGANYPSGNNAGCTGETIGEQDCSHGRDTLAAAGNLTKVGGGMAGFDFTKLDANGNPLANQNQDYPTQPWHCVKDNQTGLIWEVKTPDTMGTNLHSMDDGFNWYNTNSATNGGSVGFADDDGAICTGYDAANPASYCNTQAFVARVNASNSGTGLCGATDWRLPNLNELQSIVHFGKINPAIDDGYFPNSRSSGYWSSSPYADFSNGAWGVYFDGGGGGYNDRGNGDRVRLVRSGQ